MRSSCVCSRDDGVELSGAVLNCNGCPAVCVAIEYTIGCRVATTFTDARGCYRIVASPGCHVAIRAATPLCVRVVPSEYQVCVPHCGKHGLDFVVVASAQPGPAVLHTISGSLLGVADATGFSVGTTINGIPGSTPVINAVNYAFFAPAGAQVVVTPPMLPGYAPPMPPVIAIATLTGNLPNQNFVYIPLPQE